MTREHKLALVVGFGLVLFVGILIADHVAADRRGHLQGPVAALQDPMPAELFRGVATTFDLPNPTPPEPVDPRTPVIVEEGPVVELAPLELRTPPRRQTAPVAERRPEPAPTIRNYTVVGGDSLTSIAKRELGRSSRWMEIRDLNDLRGTNIVPGQTLRMPDRDSIRNGDRTRLREVSRPRAKSSPRIYVVRPGDSLGMIAQRELGGESRWREIQSLNSIGGTTIVAGQKLRLPGN